MTRTTTMKTLLPLSCLLLALLLAVGVTAEGPPESVDGSLEPVAEVPDAPTAGIPGSEAPLPGAESVPEVPERFPESEPIEACAGCSGTLGHFIEPSCHTCGVNEISCGTACNSHGGVAVFSCGGQGIYCECEDGAYDSCGCGSDPYPPF